MSPDSRESYVISDTPCACAGVCPMWLYKGWSLEKGPPAMVELLSCDITHQCTQALYVTWQVCFEWVCVCTCAIPGVSTFFANEVTEQVKSNSNIGDDWDFLYVKYKLSNWGLKCTVTFCLLLISNQYIKLTKKKRPIYKFIFQYTNPLIFPFLFS